MGKQVEPVFNLHSLGRQLEFVEMDLEKEKSKYQRKNAPGVTTKKINKTVNREINHMGKVLQNDAFNENPLDAIRLHLMNSIGK